VCGAEKNIFPQAGGVAGVAQEDYSVKERNAIAIFSCLAICLLIRRQRDGSAPVNRIVFLSPQFAVTGALRPEDFTTVAAQGFRSVLSNLPDGESSQYPSSTEEARLAASAKLGFRHVSATKSEVLSDRVVEGVNRALTELEGPVLAHCASGLRSAIAWAAAAARSQPAECVIAALKDAGFELAAIQDELQDQSGRAHPLPVPAALDCHCDARS
jgi:uncharacterized protein (TIGR01244 family)